MKTYFFAAIAALLYGAEAIKTEAKPDVWGKNGKNY